MIVFCKITFHRKELSTDSLRNGVTARALAISLVHVISSAPFSIAVLVPGFVENAFVRETGYYYYVGMVASFCTYLNHGCNFVLYSFFGTDFRRDTADLFGIKPSGVLPEIANLKVAEDAIQLRVALCDPLRNKCWNQLNVNTVSNFRRRSHRKGPVQRSPWDNDIESCRLRVRLFSTYSKIANYQTYTGMWQANVFCDWLIIDHVPYFKSWRKCTLIYSVLKTSEYMFNIQSKSILVEL